MSEAEEKTVVVKNVTKSSSFVRGNQVGPGIVLILVSKTVRDVLLIWGQQPVWSAKAEVMGDRPLWVSASSSEID